VGQARDRGAEESRIKFVFARRGAHSESLGVKGLRAPVTSKNRTKEIS
jgi:hypothetical protein